MTASNIAPADSRLDLALERFVDVPRERVWKALVEPEQVKQWFAPAPWKIVECQIDLRVGGRFHFVMQSPEGVNTPHTGCYLEVIPNERIIWTMALKPGFRPAPWPTPDDETCGALTFTCVITLEAKGGGTKYTARAMHGDPKATKKHEEMGFYEGWGTTFDQMVAMMKKP